MMGAPLLVVRRPHEERHENQQFKAKNPASIDDNVGRVLDWLESEGLAENTIVIYTSDQGFFLESFQMPFMIRYPKAIKPQSVCNDIICNVDFAPTFLDFAGVRIPSYMQGRSIRPLLLGEDRVEPSGQQVAYHRHWMHRDVIHEAYAHYGELFDCHEDPLELFNCYNDPKYLDIAKKMTKLLDEKMAEIGDEPIHTKLAGSKLLNGVH
ncbi:Extracellular sulfatase SULF-1-like [Colletotrichum gloeosporioides]|uniref:Extracellular sulfatase SULF-1-like n=1 Tax=Colletotrichum gloeosporioides TaxID=474922 RepID=A0A8H4FD83_COLGL|nr:Extracellular sulfatase SULF-1-like [Colletotrichum gloeosporioides]KAF3798182.1 Extracellular sulfatase SULF-1-like [Colletotrichum gloeosporioides]